MLQQLWLSNVILGIDLRRTKMLASMCRQADCVLVTLLQSKDTSRKQASTPLPAAVGTFVLLAVCVEANIVSAVRKGRLRRLEGLNQPLNRRSGDCPLSQVS